MLLSRRKMESYRRAEKVARELRYQLCHHPIDAMRLSDFIGHWMNSTGKIKYERPTRQKMVKTECKCNLSFDCICEWVKNHPGNKEFTCEYCGIYKADSPRCDKCEEETT